MIKSKMGLYLCRNNDLTKKSNEFCCCCCLIILCFNKLCLKIFTLANFISPSDSEHSSMLTEVTNDALGSTEADAECVVGFRPSSLSSLSLQLNKKINIR